MQPTNVSEWTKVPEGRSVRCHHGAHAIVQGQIALMHTFKRNSNTVIEFICADCITTMAETIPATVKVEQIRERIESTGRFFGHAAA